MQQVNASPLKPSLGLPIPASPADSGFLPRREFLPSSSKRPLSTFALLAFCNNSSIRLSAFPLPIVHIFHKFFDDRKLLKLFRDNKSPFKDKESIERDRFDPSTERRLPGGAPGRGPGEEEDLAEFTLTAKFWANPKSLETEKLLVQILVLLNSQGYSLLTSIDFGREPGDKLTLVFERPVQYQSPGTTQYITNGHGTVQTQPSHQHQNSTGSAAGSTLGTTPGSTSGPVKQLLFGLSFTSQTSFRCINPPLEATPGILQALRGAWPRGIENETKVSDGCYEFKLKGYSFFAEDTFQTDSLELTLSLLKSLQKLQFTLIASVTLTSSHSRAKDLWIFSTTDTDSLSPSHLLSSISASPVSYGAGGVPIGLGIGVGSVRYGDKEGSHLRSASADAFQQQQQGLAAPGHQRNATTPVFGSPGLPLTNTVSNSGGGGGTVGKSGGGGSGAPRPHGSVLVKKSPSAKASPKPANANGMALPLAAAFNEPGSTPPGTAGARNVTPPGTNKVPTPPATTGSKPVGMMVPPGGPAAKPMAKYPNPYQQGGGGQGQGQAILYSTQGGAGGGQGQAVLYSTPSSGNVLYSTPPSSPPTVSYSAFPPPSTSALGAAFVAPGPPPPLSNHHPGDAHWNQNISITGASPPASPRNAANLRPSSPNMHMMPPGADDQDDHTPPLLSSAAFRDTLSDQDTVRESTFSGATGKGPGATPSMMSGRSGESFDVPVTWTGSGGLASVGMGGNPGLVTTVEEEDEVHEVHEVHEDEQAALPVSTSIPGGWVEDLPAGTPGAVKSVPSGRNSREGTRPSKEKERTFDAKVDGAQLVTIPSPSSAQEAEFAAAGGVLASDTAQQQALGRRKSQEAVVHTVPGAASPEKGNGWVMINVHEDQPQPRQPEQSKSKPAVTARPPAGPLRAVNATSASSSVETPQPAPAARTLSTGSVPPTSYNAGDHPSGSGGESSSSVDKPSSSGHGPAAGAGATGTGGTTKSRSGFRKLFSREKKSSDEKMRGGGSVDESHSPKKGKRGKTAEEEPSEPARASRKMTID